ncbi:MAG: cation:proton antiporter [Myxococcales bacterium]|nr:cation:proton antiporter [Myxococcales bacterium]
MLFIAKLGSELSVRLGQPPVLGEILAGMVLGNLRLLGVDAFADAATLPSIEFLAELGVVVLLFEVGLESTLVEMKRVAPLSGAVAVIGVVAPMILGYLASRLLMPHESMSHHLFVGATLCATSVGITARVLQDLHAMDRAETKVILGAAVIDDVLGLVVLAVVSAIAEKGAPSPMEVGTIIALAVGFLVGAVILGTFIMPGFFRASAKLRSPGVLAAISIGFCLLLSGASAMAGLAAIVGAFAAGLVLDEVHVQPFGKTSKHDLSELVHPIVNLLAPVFFVRTGMLVDLGGITVEALILAGALSVVAVLGKLVAGLGVPATRANRLLVGIGMIPRGEVGLIFANVGAAIRTEDGEALVTKGAFGAIVLMVMATTVITPPWLSYQIGRLRARETP